MVVKKISLILSLIYYVWQWAELGINECPLNKGPVTSQNFDQDKSFIYWFEMGLLITIKIKVWKTWSGYS